MGGILIIITKHNEPDLWSACHRIKADVIVRNNKYTSYKNRNDTNCATNKFLSKLSLYAFQLQL